MSDSKGVLFGREASILVGSASEVLDLSEFRFRFEIHQSDAVTPNTLVARVYNLDDSTVNKIFGQNGGRSEYTKTVIQAGYKGNVAVIFDGTIKQLMRGKESNVDNVLDIYAGEWDLPYAFSTVNQTLAAGATQQDQLNAVGAAPGEGDPPVDPDALPPPIGGILARGKVLWGLKRDYYRSIGATTGRRISVQSGKFVSIPVTGYLEAEVVVLDSASGLIGVPETTQNGVTATCLLNPKIRIGTRVHINNRDLNTTIITNRAVGGAQGGTVLFASVAADGIYRVAAIDYEGDTRGTAWYSQITALAIDPTADPSMAVQEYG